MTSISCLLFCRLRWQIFQRGWCLCSSTSRPSLVKILSSDSSNELLGWGRGATLANLCFPQTQHAYQRRLRRNRAIRRSAKLRSTPPLILATFV
ncbi:hypothetical protein LINGRAHAP2_LOCUS9020 [Linum grandiflorum]